MLRTKKIDFVAQVCDVLSFYFWSERWHNNAYLKKNFNIQNEEEGNKKQDNDDDDDNDGKKERKKK